MINKQKIEFIKSKLDKKRVKQPLSALKDNITVELLEGTLCKGIYIDGFRITPNKPMGTMKTIYSDNVPTEYLIDRLETILENLKQKKQ